MSEFTIKPKNTDSVMNDENDISRDLGGYESEIRSIGSSLGFKIAAEYNLRRRINSAADRVNEHQRVTYRLYSALRDAVNVYERAENAIIGESNPSMGKLENTVGNPGSGAGGGSMGGRADGDDNDDGFDWSFRNGNVSKHTEIGGVDVGYDVEGNLLHVTAEGKVTSEWDIEKGEVSAKVGGKVGFSAADGEISGNIGYLQGNAKGSLLNAEAEGALGLSLFSGGVFAPALYAEASAKANVASGKASAQFGSDENNVHAKAKGALLGAEAKAKAQVGTIVDEDGNVKYGAAAEVGAEAYLAQGSIGGGFNLFGIEVDVTVEGKAGGAGVKAGAELTTGAAEGEIGLGFGLGVGLKVEIDWTGFKWPWTGFKWPW